MDEAHGSPHTRPLRGSWVSSSASLLLAPSSGGTGTRSPSGGKDRAPGWGQAQAETLSGAEGRARAGANSHRAASGPPPTERRGAGSGTTWGAGRCSHAGGSPEVAQSPAELSSARRESASPRL